MLQLRIAANPGLALRALTASLLIPSLLSATAPLKTADLPTIALIPDAWHSPIHYLELTNYLSQAGYSILTQRLPGCDSELPMFQSVAADATFIRQNILLPQINEGREVVLVAHSYGGSPGAEAAKGLSISEQRAAGRKGGIVGLIFICGFITRAGQTLRSMLPGGKLEPWVVDYHDGQLGIRNAKETFYNDVPQVTANLAIVEIRNQSLMTFETSTGNPGWADEGYNGRRSYLKTSLDKALAPSDQEYMIRRSTVDWNVDTFKTGHSPFLSQPRRLGEWVVREINRFRDSDDRPAVS